MSGYQYWQDREDFFAAAGRNGWTLLESRPCPWLGPRGERLYTDVAVLPPKGSSSFSAAKMLVVITGTHGAENPLGSWAVREHMDNGTFLTFALAGIAVLVIHAANAHGAAWIRRTGADDIDPNRNGGPSYETVSHYGDYLELVMPADGGPEAQAALRQALADPARAPALMQAVASGQHSWPKAIFYGGRELGPVLGGVLSIVKRYASGASDVAVLDLHTGLGLPLCKPFEGMLISAAAAGSAPAERVRAWFDTRVTIPPYPVPGNSLDAITRALPGARVTALALELGVEVSCADSLPILVWENWAWHACRRGDVSEEELYLARQNFSDVFHPRFHRARYRDAMTDETAEVLAGIRRGLTA